MNFACANFFVKLFLIVEMLFGPTTWLGSNVFGQQFRIVNLICANFLWSYYQSWNYVICSDDFTWREHFRAIFPNHEFYLHQFFVKLFPILELRYLMRRLDLAQTFSGNNSESWILFAPIFCEIISNRGITLFVARTWLRSNIFGK